MEQEIVGLENPEEVKDLERLLASIPVRSLCQEILQECCLQIFNRVPFGFWIWFRTGLSCEAVLQEDRVAVQQILLGAS